MYLFETGLGQTSRPQPTGGLVHLKVKFRHSFKDFLREVENTFKTLGAGPTARMLIKKSHRALQRLHKEMLKNKLQDTDPVILLAQVYYRRSKGTRLADDILLHTWGQLIDI